MQIKPSQKERPDAITNFLMANESLFDEFIRSGNLRKAALIANSVLQSVSQETSTELQERYKVLLKPNLLLKK